MGTMTLAAGTKLGPYEILAPLGAGGGSAVLYHPPDSGANVVRVQSMMLITPTC